MIDSLSVGLTWSLLLFAMPLFLVESLELGRTPRSSAEGAGGAPFRRLWLSAGASGIEQNK
jgi:hypothetical protein